MEATNTSNQLDCSAFVENSISKFVALALSVALSFTALALLYGIIWCQCYKQSFNHFTAMLSIFS